jgi:hypothetical protein
LVGQGALTLQRRLQSSRPRRDFTINDKWNIARDHTENTGWGGYQKPKKSKEQLDLERRREPGKKFRSDTSELIAIAAKSKVKVKKLAPTPHPDDDLQAAPESFVGPCQLHVANMKAWRAAKAAGTVAMQEDEPVFDERRRNWLQSAPITENDTSRRRQSKRAQLHLRGTPISANTLEGSTLRNSSLNSALSLANDLRICRRSAAFRASLSLR